MTLIVTESTAVRSPNFLVRFFVSIMFCYLGPTSSSSYDGGAIEGIGGPAKGFVNVRRGKSRDRGADILRNPCPDEDS